VSDGKPFPPVFATNHPGRGETVADEVNRMLRGLREDLAQPPNLALATAYINPQGFALLQAEVELAPKVRILLGAEPDEPVMTRLESGEIASFDEVAAAYERGLRHERDLVGFDRQSDAAARAMVAWLRRAEQGEPPRVEVRRFTKGFLHGKAFIAEHPRMSAVLAGSSNLTLAGLSWNRELNLGYPAGQYTGLVVSWFDELWAESEPYDLAGLYEARWSPHSPWTVFLRMLHELYGSQPVGAGERAVLRVTEFQLDGISRALRILDQLGGVLVCDEVGLGKTFIAGEVIRKVTMENRQRVLVVVPASLKNSTWIPFLRRYDLYSNRVNVMSFDELRIEWDKDKRNLDDYALVVVDEAHNLRNPNTLRAEAVTDLLWGENPKKVMLLTATPVNNSLRDLHTLVSYFVRNDAEFAAAGIPSIADYIRDAQRLDPESLSPEHLFDLMDRVAVRRTRSFIKRHYANDRIMDNRGELVPVVFPTPVVERLTYELDLGADDIAGRVIHALAVEDDEELVIRAGRNRDPQRLSLARYAPSLYSLGNDVDRLQITNVGLLRSGLLKRLESSTAALHITLGRLLESHEAFLRALEGGWVITGDALRDFVGAGGDDLDAFLDGLDEDGSEHVMEAEGFDVDALRRDVEMDAALLEELRDLAQARIAEGPDAKVLELVEYLEKIAKDADRPVDGGLGSADRRKLIVFSTYTDTVVDLHGRLSAAINAAKKGSALAAYKGRIAPAVYGARGGGAQSDRAEVLAGFAPRTAGEVLYNGEPVSKDLYDLLVATDVLAEGVNLQQAGRMVNFDLPWNPMRLVQRHGRIDRIGSPHPRVVIGCFFPAANLDALLGLEETLQRKIAYANAAIGAGTVIPDQRSNPDVEVLFHDQAREIRELFDENPAVLIEGGGSGALSGEEYRRRLANALRNEFLRDEVLNLPYGSGSGFVSQRVRRPGYIFCAKVGAHEIPWFRFVAAEPGTWSILRRDDGSPWIDDDTLTCLTAADPGDGELHQVLPEAALGGVFDAWEVARKDVHREWTKLADPSSTQPSVPKALRDAYQHVSDHGGFLPRGSEGQPSVQESLLAQLNARWGRDVVAAVREIMRNEKLNNRGKVEALLALAREMGLRTPPKVEPLPSVKLDDIRVITWMAVQPANSSS